MDVIPYYDIDNRGLRVKNGSFKDKMIVDLQQLKILQKYVLTFIAGEQKRLVRIFRKLQSYFFPVRILFSLGKSLWISNLNKYWG